MVDDNMFSAIIDIASFPDFRIYYSYVIFYMESNSIYYIKTFYENNTAIGYCPFEIRTALLYPTQRCSSRIIHGDGMPADNNNKLDETFIVQIVLYRVVFLN